MKIWQDSIELRRKKRLLDTIEVIQYWSQGSPPKNILDNINKWNLILNNIGLKSIILFDKKQARRWIIKNAKEFLISFDSSPNYAAESDVFRLSYAYKNGCIWIDGDESPTTNSSEIISEIIKMEKSIFSIVFITKESNNLLKND